MVIGPLSKILPLQEEHPLCPCCLSITFQLIIHSFNNEDLENQPSFEAYLVEICHHLLTPWKQHYFTTAAFKN